MSNANFVIPQPKNEPFYGYLPGSSERAALKAELDRQYNTTVEIPLVIGGRKIWTDTVKTCIMPSEHDHVLATYCMAGEKELKMAKEAAMAAKAE